MSVSKQFFSRPVGRSVTFLVPNESKRVASEVPSGPSVYGPFKGTAFTL